MTREDELGKLANGERVSKQLKCEINMVREGQKKRKHN
jgi:hypothetical protein